ncbi:MAG: hypothetical protein K2F81_09105 [Ruminococcus sp.]|nr:hypothetical protein [Ruminococcus sp.]
MDTFKEQLVKKLPEKNDQIKKLLIIFASCLLAIFCFLFFMGSSLSIFGVVLAGGIIYGGYYLITNLIIEYEYILTNGELDIDKIVAQRSRKRLATLKLAAALEFGVADGSLRISPNETLIQASGNDAGQTDYYIRLNHSSLGNTVLIFTPSEEMLELIKNCLPRNLRYGR